MLQMLLAAVISLQGDRAAQMGAKSASPRDEAVFLAILHDLIGPLNDELNRGTSPTPEGNRRIALNRKTLVVCSKPVQEPCISEDVLKLSRRAIAEGSWPAEFGPLLEKSTVPQQVGLLRYQDLTMSPDASNETPSPRPLAVSAPVYVGEMALVYVQFAHAYNWLLLVRSDTRGHWFVDVRYG